MVQGHSPSPETFFASQTASHAYGLWKAVCRTVTEGLPAAGPSRDAYVAQWDEVKEKSGKRYLLPSMISAEGNRV